MKKIVSVILIILTAAALFSCNEKAEDATTDTGKPKYERVDISGIPSPLSINGVSVPYSHFRYYYAAVKTKYDRYDESYWDTHDYSSDILEETFYYISHDAAVKEYAEKLGVALSDYELSEIDQDISNMRYYYEDESDYYKALDGDYLTEEVYRDMSIIDKLYTKTYEYLTGEESGYKISSDSTLVRKFLDKYVMHADHILILNDPGDDINENETLIATVYDDLVNYGGDFQKLKEKYSEDDITNYNSIGYYFTEGDIGKEFENVAMSLDPGEMSGIIKTHYGYHIIIRLELDEDYIEENWDDYFVPFYQKHMYETALKKLMDAQIVIHDSTYYTYTPKTIK